MARDTVPMGEMFAACKAILDEKCRPIRYTELTSLALDFLGYPVDSVNWNRQIEDVREKMLLARRHNSFYVPKPYCIGAIKSWFTDPFQLEICHSSDPVVIPGHATSGAGGAYEALQRTRHMLKKTKAPLHYVHEARARGLVLERHVVDWFRQNWPGLVLPADNEGKWDAPCNHDFKLTVGDRVFNVDIFGPKADGTYGKSPYKRTTQYHLLCRIIGQDILWEDVIPGNELENKPNVFAAGLGGRAPLKMIVWLNCAKHNIPYGVMRQYANKYEAMTT